MKKHRFMIVALLLMAVLALAACGGGAEPTEAPQPTEPPAATEAPAATQPPAPTEAPPPTQAPTMEKTGFEWLDRAYAGEFSGTTVTLLGVMVDEEARKMEMAVKPFEDATGIDVQYTGTKEFETQINVRVDAGDAPDVVD
ncbi:MAG: carbohydrate ABC transporter substrate-binding protein, partial [Chloroflexi bacterium]|nr:carbohydrate ABC transporter substrate-binding protein [Chloroflexota bacterium]